MTISAYKFKDADPNGTWFLWEKREDWQNSDVGQMIGEPQPDYVLFRSYGTEERRVLAMAADDMDILTDISPESLDILRKQNDKVRAWFTEFPYANLDDPCERGIHFNTSIAPYDDAKTRWALALAIDLQRASIATFSGMLRASPLGMPPTIGADGHLPPADGRVAGGLHARGRLQALRPGLRRRAWPSSCAPKASRASPRIRRRRASCSASAGGSTTPSRRRSS